MRMTTHSDHSLRLLMFLGLQENRLATIEEAANRYGISKNNLMKIAHQLGRAGYIETVRGRKGGLRLARRPGDIVIGEVIRLTEEDLNLVECFHRNGNCIIAPACELRLALDKALQAFLAVLDDYTLADLLKPRSKLGDLLGVEHRGSA